MGDHVRVRRAEVRPARRVVVAPAQKNLQLRGSPEFLRRTLLSRPLVGGDLISTAVYHRTASAADQMRYPEDIFRIFFQQPAYGLQ